MAKNIINENTPEQESMEVVESPENQVETTDVQPEVTAESPEVVETTDVEEVATPDEAGELRGQIIALIGQFIPETEVVEGDELSFLKGVFVLVSRLAKIHDSIYQIAEEFPDFAEALAAMLEGMDPREAIHRYVDLDSMNPPEGAPDYEGIKKAKEERQITLSERASHQQKYEENQQVSLENVKAYVKERGMSNEEAIELLDKLTAFENDLYDGMLSPEHITAFAKGFMYDTDIQSKEEEAQNMYEDGVVAGRNEQISKEFKKPKVGDGIPSLMNTAEQSKTNVNRKPILNSRADFRV